MNLHGLPTYRCHKQVRAVQIRRIDVRQQAYDALLIPEGGYAPIPVSLEFMEKHRPHVGGYLVVYDDGYLSFSPAGPFEAGHTLIERA
ncbi:hypothetical protein [uncultured Marinobacter sp.]|uniref:hypothetical protein n=1 Tax=uncultured Marinobacter sp. TaxID=187379 RepID=UPI00258D1FCD|nr:hypothetical protein [uncultured Marinobacter sp.]